MHLHPSQGAFGRCVDLVGKCVFIAPLAYFTVEGLVVQAKTETNLAILTRRKKPNRNKKHALSLPSQICKVRYLHTELRATMCPQLFKKLLSQCTARIQDELCSLLSHKARIRPPVHGGPQDISSKPSFQRCGPQHLAESRDTQMRKNSNEASALLRPLLVTSCS